MSTTNRLVVKDNALIDASFNLSLVEQRIMLLAIVEARETEALSPNAAIKISVNSYEQQFKADSNNIYNAIKEAARTLKRREFSYLDRYEGELAYTTANWVNKITYVDNSGFIVLYLSEDVISLISGLEEQFTKYHLEQVSNFKSKYSTRLYELIIKWLSKGVTEKYDIAELRSKLGLAVNEYTTMSNFKINVLDKALKEINKHTDIVVDYDQFKQGKSIKAVQFRFTHKKPVKKVLKQIDTSFSLSEAQIKKYSKILAKEHQISDLAETKDYASFESWIANILRDPKSVRKSTSQRIFTTLKEKTDFSKA